MMEQSINLPSQLTQQPKSGAGFGHRFVAQVIDLILHNVLWLFIGAISGVLIGVYAVIAEIEISTLATKLEAATLIDYVFAVLGYILYHTICEGIHGATLGKLILKIHVLKENGEPATIGPAFVRSVVYILDSVFFGIVALASMSSSILNQRVGDKWAKTIVVERKSLDQYEWPSGLKFITAFLIAIAVDGFLVIFSLVIKLM